MSYRARSRAKARQEITDPCKVLAKQQSEETQTAEEYRRLSRNPQYTPSEQQMFKEDAAQEEEHATQRRRAQILRGCIR